MKVHLDRSALLLFVECLQSLPNLHTLEVGWVQSFTTTPLENALERIKLPQIKTLIIPPTAYPLLQRCCDVENVTCTGDRATSADGFLRSLPSDRGSNIMRLAIPLVLWENPSRT